jgi:dehydrogenase/reductase SDR family protein 1
MGSLDGKVAVVTGASRGIGKGIALGLGEAGATVYVTGRTTVEGSAPLPGTIGATAEEVTRLGGTGIAVRVDHGSDDDIKALFDQVKSEQGHLDILVNNVFKVPDSPVWTGEFWNHPISIWDDMVGIGLRAHYVASHHAVPLMLGRKNGLIVNVSSRGAAGYTFSVAYGVGKAGTDRLAADMAVELKEHDIASVSIWPSKVKTEFIMQQVAQGKVEIDPKLAQSRLLSGRAVVALATDPKLMNKTGQVLEVADLKAEYGFKDVEEN